MGVMEKIFKAGTNKYSRALARPSNSTTQPSEFTPTPGPLDVVVGDDGVANFRVGVSSHNRLDPFKTPKVAAYSADSAFIQGLREAGLGGEIPVGGILLLGNGGEAGPRSGDGPGAEWVECDGRIIGGAEGRVWSVPSLVAPPGTAYFQRLPSEFVGM